MMIRTKQKELRDSLEQALTNDSNYLYSFTEKLSDTVDPNAIFRNTESYKGSRFFWTSPEEQFVLIGVGYAYLLRAEHNRFQSIEAEWKNLTKNAFIENPEDVPGTGPLLMGGFSFDPNEKGTDWENFQSSRMILPKFLITIHGETSYITHNVLLEDGLLINETVRHYDSFKHSLLQINNHKATPNVQLEKEAVLAEKWKKTIEKATDTISSGELSKVVLARELKVTFQHDISTPTILENLMEQQKQSYIFAMESEKDCFLGATPERLVKVQSNELLSTCLAGTAPRGESLSEDEQIGVALLNDNKNIQEHAFVVNMIKNAIEACCDEVVVPDAPVLYKLKNLQHLYTPVKGKLSPEYTILNVVERLHPTPAMGGVPREKALRFIQEEEALNRGWYAAPIGWLDANGNGEFAVAIRSGLMKGKVAHLYAGCGIVQDSDPESEFMETEIKLKPMLHALGGLE